MRPSILVSRADRIGDLVLSLPSLGVLRSAGFKDIILHCSDYARGVGEWARFNGLVDRIVTDQDSWTALAQDARQGKMVGLSLFHGAPARALFKEIPFSQSFGPRSKFSALWTYQRTLAQHRSRVAKSEMQYNIDLTHFCLRHLGIEPDRFRGLPALAVPQDWYRQEHVPGHVVVLSNRGSAKNATMDFYLAEAERLLQRGDRVDFLVSGDDAEERLRVLEQRGWVRRQNDGQKVCIWRDFSTLEALIAFISRAKHVLCSSTGPLHIAHAAGVPVTGIYPRDRVTGFERWRPDGYWHSAAIKLIEI